MFTIITIISMVIIYLAAIYEISSKAKQIKVFIIFLIWIVFLIITFILMLMFSNLATITIIVSSILVSYSLSRIVVKLGCLDSRHIYIYTFTSFIASILFSITLYYWLNFRSIWIYDFEKLAILSSIFNILVLIIAIYSSYLMFNFLNRFWYSKITTIFLALPLINIITFPIIILSSLKRYKACKNS